MKALLNLTIILGLAYLLYSFAGLAYLLYGASVAENHSRHLKEDMRGISGQDEFTGPFETKMGKGKEGNLKIPASDEIHSNLMANALTADLKGICSSLAEGNSDCRMAICSGVAVNDSRSFVWRPSISESTIAGNVTTIASQKIIKNGHGAKNFKIVW